MYILGVVGFGVIWIVVIGGVVIGVGGCRIFFLIGEGLVVVGVFCLDFLDLVLVIFFLVFVSSLVL